MKSIYDIELDSAEGMPHFLQQFKGKAVLLINTTVGCGNAGQMESIQWIQEDMAGEDFSVVAIPTNDFCGPSITKGKWSQGITCGLDSKLYGEDVYGVTFPFSEMITSNPADIPLEAPWLGKGPGLNGNGQPFGERHELYLEVSKQVMKISNKKIQLGIIEKTDYESRYLNEHDGGTKMNANFEKYLIDKDGYVVKHYPATTLNWDVERTLKEDLAAKGIPAKMGPDRSEYIFNEENSVIRDHIERLMSGEKSIINPAYDLLHELITV
jgi:glutathione peroxidase-family protein